MRLGDHLPGLFVADLRDGTRIDQVDVRIADLPAAVSAERQKMTSADRKQMVVCMKADRRTPMAVVSRVKQALRDANATRIIYVAKEKKTKE